MGGALAVMGTACGGNSNGSGNDKTDSVPEPITMLPDTALASAEDVDYEIEKLDSVTDGTLVLDVENAYDTVHGNLGFRGGARRDMPMAGKIKGVPTRIEQDWVFQTYVDNRKTPLGVWGGGTGWTAQPLLVEWTPAQVAEIKSKAKGLTPNFKSNEIMVGSLCSKIYFLDFETGQPTREPIDVHNPVKGTIMLDPAYNNSLYVGQAVPAERPFGHLAIDLNSQEIKYMWGEDHKAKRNWGGYDSSPIVAGQFLFWPAENGTIYKYSRKGNGELVMHSALRYTIKGDGRGAGVESSMSVYRNYGFIGDNHGDVLCINLNTMKPVWHYDNVDDIDASPVIEVVNGVPYIYFGCEVDLQGVHGICSLVKLNGLTGQPVWKRDIECKRLDTGGKHFDGGLYSTPLLGHGNCEGMMFLNMCQTGNSSSAEFLAIDRKDGHTIYSIPLKTWAWSSPVPFYNEKNELFIMAGDTAGYAYLINGKTGNVIFTDRLVANFESSPVVKDNYAVVGSRGDKIYRFAIK